MNADSYLDEIIHTSKEVNKKDFEVGVNKDIKHQLFFVINSRVLVSLSCQIKQQPMPSYR